MSKKLVEFRMWVNQSDHAKAGKMAAKEGESVAELYRRAMAEYLTKRTPPREAKP